MGGFLTKSLMFHLDLLRLWERRNRRNVTRTRIDGTGRYRWVVPTVRKVTYSTRDLRCPVESDNVSSEEENDDGENPWSHGGGPYGDPEDPYHF